ncbi:LuxR C-terminal-related transcriptional regulator [Geojedonia litorea]|uniref:LuxR C-terminal-related transcriptional regulator n=1 Tax=Geojedonia litorea TaxID=1268269 RepID=A0ABV9N4U5_9FLAO
MSLAQYSPYFQNFSLSEYNAGNQNWDVSKADNGKLYVANNNGLLEYDGLKWTFNELPNKTTIRSVLAHDSLIYTGSYEEFGYWKKNKKGELIYHSLSASIKDEISLSEEFWQIITYNNAIIFRSFSNIYIYENGKINKIKPASTVISCDQVDGKLYVSTLRGGIFRLDGTNLTQVITNEELSDVKVISISKMGSNLFITTALKGCFIYGPDQKLAPWNSEINTLIKQHQLNSFSKLNTGNLVFGTIKNGIYGTDSRGDIIFHVNKENGLANNTILSQCVDSSNKLWLGLDNGVASIDLNSHHSFYNDISGRLGAVYDVIRYKNTIYIGSNTGLFYLDNNGELQFIEGSQGQVWDLRIINNQLFCGHNNGTYIVESNRISLISEFTGGWVIKKVPEQNNIYVQGTYAGLVKFKNDSGKWTVKHLGKTTIPVRFLVFEDKYTAWAAHAYNGLYKIKFSDNYDSIISTLSYANKGLLSNYNVRVYNIKNNICFKTNEGWQKYEPLLDSIVPYKFLNENLGKDSYIISDDNTDQIAVKSKKDLINFISLNDQKVELSLTSNFFENRLIVGFEKISKLNDSIYALNLNDGFMLIDGINYSENLILQAPIIERIEVDKAMIDINTSNPVEFSFNQSISISVSSPKSDNHYFEYAISNLDSLQWYKLDKEKLELSNLSNGSYTILFRAANNFGGKSDATPLDISVLPPWYKNNIGFALYGLLIIITIVLFYALHKRKVDKEQKLLQLKFEQEQRELIKEKTLENERKIVELKNEALKNEVKLKSKQLANTAMALVKKNETLMELKKELVEHKSGFDNYYSYKKLLKNIDNSIGHKDEWEVFEYNFNQVHEEFFNQLKKQFPNLTHKDLKICAYIKMNLSTKEIAPLLNISIRGVETHRYRLKRKLNLENDISIGTYLRKFK